VVARLKEVPFVAGERYSIADITAMVTADFAAKAIDFPVPGERTAVKRWYDRVSKRPGPAA
jgi:glutathione S-transferase